MATKFSWRPCRFLVQRVATLFAGNLRVALRTCCVVLLLLMGPFAHAAKVEDFIPKEIIFYLKLQDMDEVYGEIEISENWEKALSLLPDVSNWQEMQQGLSMGQGLLGTDLLGVIETVGYRTALAVWLDEAAEPETGLVIHSGGNLDKLQQLTKIIEGLIGMDSAYTLHLDAGVYQRARYNALEWNQGIVKYGFVDDFLVIGAGNGSFEKLMDTYRTDMPSIQQNPEFTEVLEEVGSGEVIVFANMPHVLSVMENDLETAVQTRLAIFQSMFGRLSLLETDTFLEVSAAFNPNQPENEIGLFLKSGQKLESLNALSGEEDLFVAVAPQILGGVWELAHTQMAEHPEADIDAGIAFVEGLLNLNLEADIMTGLTGELALSVPDLTRFDPEALRSIRAEFDGIFELDAGDVETNGGIIFNPSNRMKWNLIGNSVSNLQSGSVSQTDYKGTTVSGFASNIYHSEIDGLFLMGFAEDQVFTLIDEITQKKKPSYLKQVPKTPTMFAQLNLARGLEREKGSPPPDKLIVDAKEIPLLLAWLSVEDDTALLEVTLSENEMPIETLAKLIPFLLWNMDVQ